MNHERKKAITQSGTLCPIWSMEAAEKTGKMLREIEQANLIIDKISATAQNNAVKGGFAAETWHTESFNLDAILKDKNIRAFTDNFSNTPLKKNHTVHDIVVMNGDEQLLGAQLKYFKNADATQKAFRSTKDGVHQYKDSDLFLGPSDQIEGIKSSAQKDILKNYRTRTEVSDAAKKVKDNVSEKLDVEGIQSTALQKKEAEHLGASSKIGKKLHEDMQKNYQHKAMIQQSTRAAGSAAIVTTVIAGTINTFQYINEFKNGKINADEAVLKILQNTAIAAGDSALKAGVASASVSISARSLPSLFTGTIFKKSLANGTIAGASVCAIDLIQSIILFSAGKITATKLESRTGKNLFQTGAGVAGASIGASIGVIGGPVGALVGSLLGGLITSLAMNIAVDNHIDKNFNLILLNTESIVENGMIMKKSLEYLQYSQQYYAEFERNVYLSERHFQRQIKTLQLQSLQLANKIKNL